MAVYWYGGMVLHAHSAQYKKDCSTGDHAPPHAADPSPFSSELKDLFIGTEECLSVDAKVATQGQE